MREQRPKLHQRHRVSGRLQRPDDSRRLIGLDLAVEAHGPGRGQQTLVEPPLGRQRRALRRAVRRRGELAPVVANALRATARLHLVFALLLSAGITVSTALG